MYTYFSDVWGRESEIITWQITLSTNGASDNLHIILIILICSKAYKLGGYGGEIRLNGIDDMEQEQSLETINAP